MILPYQQQTLFSIAIVTKQRQRSKKNDILFPSHVALRATLKHRRLQDPDRSWNITRKKRENRGHGCLPPPLPRPEHLATSCAGGGGGGWKNETRAYLNCSLRHCNNASTIRCAIAITSQLFAATFNNASTVRCIIAITHQLFAAPLE